MNAHRSFYIRPCMTRKRDHICKVSLKKKINSVFDDAESCTHKGHARAWTFLCLYAYEALNVSVLVFWWSRLVHSQRHGHTWDKPSTLVTWLGMTINWLILNYFWIRNKARWGVKKYSKDRGTIGHIEMIETLR